MRAAFYDHPLYKQKQSKITKKYWRAGRFDFKRKPLITKLCVNPNCKLPFQIKPYKLNIYCSSRCAAKVNNLKRPRKINSCLNCGSVKKWAYYKYCSNKCQRDDIYKQYIARWKSGLESGIKGITTKILSGHIRRYLFEKYNNKCSICGWDKVHLITKIVPLEVNHINGDANDNKEENLQLICPNCHSLTSNFRNLNKGKGRKWRLEYIKDRSN